jgi:hypothetical protein
MNEAFILLWDDIVAMFTNVSVIAMMRPALFGLWCLIVIMPLKGADRRDVLACAVYSVFLTAAAAVLIFALPNFLLKEQTTLNDQFITLMIIAALGSIRWSWSIKDLTGINTDIFGTEPEAKKGARKNGK